MKIEEYERLLQLEYLGWNIDFKNKALTHSDRVYPFALIENNFSVEKIEEIRDVCENPKLPNGCSIRFTMSVDCLKNGVSQ